MVRESTAKGGLFGFLFNLFSSQESDETSVSWLTELKEPREKEVKSMYCDQCGFELGYGVSTCTKCGRKMADIESGMIRNYETMPEPTCNSATESEPYTAQEADGEPAHEEDTTPIYQQHEDNEITESQEPDEEQELSQSQEPDESQESHEEPEHCDCHEPCPPEEAPVAEELNYAQKKDKKAILGHEIEELRHRIQPCLDEIARFSNSASADRYSLSLDSINEALERAREVEGTLHVKTAEYENIIINPCCEHGFHNADKYCGTCGEYLGGMGWRCSCCQTLNKDNNHFCRGCGYSPPEGQVA